MKNPAPFSFTENSFEHQSRTDHKIQSLFPRRTLLNRPCLVQIEMEKTMDYSLSELEARARRADRRLEAMVSAFNKQAEGRLPTL